MTHRLTLLLAVTFIIAIANRKLKLNVVSFLANGAVLVPYDLPL